MTGKQLLLFFNLFPTALVVVLLSFFFAGGAMTDSPSRAVVAAPWFLICIPIWLTGVLFYLLV
ncbi:hypothetical protein [Marinococcus sp. PL1-022]|uniref:hypothetical protein n=1 Tax=Marinococcus sp. PL1-022 TaxID=3095363 RepID=UPI0029C274C9|nr:hypothetical protein [Marinococcus sp. PL1-022]MDX6152661.1 hypothetical protein [Marinococcus sp. PL1-022]